jgi:adenylate cyclase
MHVLARSDLLQRLRLASGLVLFTFVATHFLNHALGLISLEAMQEMQAWRKLVTRSWLAPGLGRAPCGPTSRRLTWKLPFDVLTRAGVGPAPSRART